MSHILLTSFFPRVHDPNQCRIGHGCLSRVYSVPLLNRLFPLASKYVWHVHDDTSGVPQMVGWTKFSILIYSNVTCIWTTATPCIGEIPSWLELIQSYWVTYFNSVCLNPVWLSYASTVVWLLLTCNFWQWTTYSSEHQPEVSMVTYHRTGFNCESLIIANCEFF